MNESFSLPPDGLAGLATPELQRLAARMAQDAFGRLFRLTVAGDAGALKAAVAEIDGLARNWARAAADDEARALRLALLLYGIEQWSLAYRQAFGLAAIPGVDALAGGLNGAADAARLQHQCAAIEQVESDAVDFKLELARNIHLALWHAMIACEDQDEARAILAALCGRLVALTTRMPRLGGRLVADALALIQLRCLSDAAAASPLARETTQQLFAALEQALSAAIFAPLLAHANRTVLAWQQSRRGLH